MADAVPPSLRVLVKGASTATWISWMGGPRSDMTFSRVLENELRRHGHAAEVRNTGVLGTPTRHFFKDFEQDVAQWSPDVVVIVSGHYETIHAVLPRWFERFSNRPNYRPGPVRHWVRRRVVRAAWKLAAEAQAVVDRALPAVISRRRMRRVGADLEGYVRLVQQVGTPLVIVLELLPPPPKQQAWFPGMAERIALANSEHAAAIGRIGRPDVQMLPTAPLAHARYGSDLAQAVADGFHFTPEMHRDIGSALAERVIRWAATQPHLGTAGASHHRSTAST